MFIRFWVPEHPVFAVRLHCASVSVNPYFLQVLDKVLHADSRQ